MNIEGRSRNHCHHGGMKVIAMLLGMIAGLVNTVGELMLGMNVGVVVPNVVDVGVFAVTAQRARNHAGQGRQNERHRHGHGDPCFEHAQQHGPMVVRPAARHNRSVRGLSIEA